MFHSLALFPLGQSGGGTVKSAPGRPGGSKRKNGGPSRARRFGLLCGETAYSAVIAPVGQAPSQAPQSMQAPASTTATPSSTFTAPTGQAPSQAPQPMHASETLCAIIELSFRPVPQELMWRGTTPRGLLLHGRSQPLSGNAVNQGVYSCADCSKDKPKRQD